MELSFVSVPLEEIEMWPFGLLAESALHILGSAVVPNDNKTAQNVLFYLAGRSGLQIPVGARKVSPLYKVQDYGGHSHSYAKSSGKYVPRVKRPASGSDLLLPCGAEIKNGWSYTSTPPIPSKRVQENFIFYFTFRAKQKERIREIFYI
jgi:hypothetical protein